MQGKTSPRDRDALRRQRALYYALKSSDDAFFSFIPRQQLFYALNKSYQPGAKRPRRPTRYDCQTQHTGTLEWRLLASADAPLNLWESGTVLKWIARSAVPGGSAQASGRALRAAVNMWHAAEYWNSIMDGRVTFRYAEDITSANINIPLHEYEYLQCTQCEKQQHMAGDVRYALRRRLSRREFRVRK